MIHKVCSPLAGHVRVIFELPSCMWADRIFLSGDFNNWDSTNFPLRQDRNGVWRAMVDLPRGTRSEFRYLVDGQWRTDFHADGFTQNQFGTQNSVIIAELPEVEPETELVSGLVREIRKSGPFPDVPNRPLVRHLETMAA